MVFYFEKNENKTNITGELLKKTGGKDLMMSQQKALKLQTKKLHLKEKSLLVGLSAPSLHRFLVKETMFQLILIAVQIIQD